MSMEEMRLRLITRLGRVADDCQQLINDVESYQQNHPEGHLLKFDLEGTRLNLAGARRAIKSLEAGGKVDQRSMDMLLAGDD